MASHDVRSPLHYRTLQCGFIVGDYLFTSVEMGGDGGRWGEMGGDGGRWGEMGGDGGRWGEMGGDGGTLDWHASSCYLHSN